MNDLLIKCFGVLFCLVIYQTLAQRTEPRIQKVENGLTLQRTVAPGETFQTGNLVERLKDFKIPGASVTVVRNRKIDWSKTYGTAEAKGSTQITGETLFQCASIGKMITALTAMALVEQGKLDLDEDVNLKLKRWQVQENEKTADQKVTLRHLLSHSAGFTDEYGFKGYDPSDDIPSLVQMLNGEPPSNARKSLTVETVPGEKELYSGGGYLIVQVLLEDVSGEPFETLVQELILNPFGMSQTTYDYRPDKNSGAQVATGHTGNGKPLKNKKYHLYPEKAAAGPWTTAEDLARLILGIQKLNATRSEAIKEILTPQINNKGLGVNLKGLDKPEAFWHAGQNLGYTALLYGLTDNSGGAVILLNSDGGERFMKEFMTSVAMAYDWPVMQSEQGLSIPSELGGELVGNYGNSDGSQKLIVENGSKGLTARSEESKKSYPLFRIGENHYTFQDAQDYYKLVFQKDPENSQAILIYTESIGKKVELKKTN